MHGSIMTPAERLRVNSASPVWITFLGFHCSPKPCRPMELRQPSKYHMQDGRSSPYRGPSRRHPPSPGRKSTPQGVHLRRPSRLKRYDKLSSLSETQRKGRRLQILIWLRSMPVTVISYRISFLLAPQ